MMDHAFAVGWSADGRLFGYCWTSGGSGASACELVSRDGAREELTSYDAKKGVDEGRDEALRERARALGLAHRDEDTGRFGGGPRGGASTFGGELDIVWSTQPAPRAALRLGARVHDGSTSYALTVAHPGEDWELHPEVIAVSPDGEWIGVVLHAFRGEFSDHFRVAVAPVATLAAQAFEDTGSAHRRRGEMAAAERWFARAERARRLVP
jgi:hypothetical protein